jgi:hypothetical protein
MTKNNYYLQNNILKIMRPKIWLKALWHKELSESNNNPKEILPTYW